MADISIGVAIDPRGAVTGGRQVRQSLAEVNAEGAKTLSLGRQITSVLGAGLGAFSAASALRQLFNEASAAERAETKLNATLRATRGAAGLTAGELKKLSGETQKLSEFSDDAATSAQSMLLTFNRIGRDVFPRAQRGAEDFAAFMETDLVSAAQLVGRALQAPDEGIAGLNRTLRLFTDEQEKVIVAMVKTGRTAQAQERILQALEERVGGTAAAMRGTMLGAARALGNSFSDLLEGNGDGIPAVTAALNDLNDTISSPSFRSAAQNLSSNIIGGIGAGISTIQRFGDELLSLGKLLAVTFVASRFGPFINGLAAATAAEVTLRTATLSGNAVIIGSVEARAQAARMAAWLAAEELNAARATELRTAATVRSIEADLAASVRGGQRLTLTAALTAAQAELTAATAASTAASATYTTATTAMAAANARATLASQALAVASRGLASVMALLGGPAGVILIAAYALYSFATMSSEAEKKTDAMRRKLEMLEGSAGQFSLENARSELQQLNDQIAQKELELTDGGAKNRGKSGAVIRNGRSERQLKADLEELVEQRQIQMGIVKQLESGENKLTQALQAQTGATDAQVLAEAKLIDKAEQRKKQIEAANESAAEQLRQMEIQLGLLEKTSNFEEAQLRAQMEAQGVRSELIEKIVVANRQLQQFTDDQAMAIDSLLTSELRDQIKLLKEGYSLEQAREKTAEERLKLEAALLRAQGQNVEANKILADLERMKLQKEADRLEAIRAIRMDGAVELENQMEDVGRTAEDALTEGLMRAFERGEDGAKAFTSSMKNYFNTLVIEPLIKALVQPVAGAVNGIINGAIGSVTGGLGLGGIGAGIGQFAQGAWAGSGFGGFFGPAGVAEGAAGQAGYGFGASTGGGMLIAGALGYAGGSLFAGKGPFRDDTANYTGTGAAVGMAVAGPVGAAVGFVVGALASGIQGQWKTASKDVAIDIVDGTADATMYEIQKKKRLGRSTKWRTFTDDVEELDDQLSAAFGQMYDGISIAAKSIGLEVGEFKTRVNANVKGMDAKAAQESINAALVQAAEQLALQVVPALKDFQRENEQLLDTYARVINQTRVLRDVMGALSGSVQNLSMETADQVFSMGGPQFGQNLQSFMQEFLSDSQKLSIVGGSLGKVFADLGLQLPRTRQELTALLGSLDLETADGQEAFTSIINQQQGLAEYFRLIDQARQQQIDALEEQVRIGERLAGIARSIREYLNSLRTSELAPGDAVTRAGIALDQFRELQSRAAAGDEDAAGQLRDAAQNALELAREAFASSDAYQAVFNEVTGGLDQVASILERDQTVANLVQLRAQITALQNAEVAAIQQLQSAVVTAIQSIPPPVTIVQGGGGSGGGGGGSYNYDNPGPFTVVRDDGTVAGGASASPASSGLFSGLSGLAGVASRFFADGGAFTNGVVSRPTAFNMGVMGEAGAEGILPLSRTRDGSLGVTANIGGGEETNQNLRALVRLTQRMAAAIVEMNDRIAEVESRNRRSQQGVL